MAVAPSPTDTILALALRARPHRWRKLPTDRLTGLRLSIRYAILQAREALAFAHARQCAAALANAEEIHAQCVADLDALADEACRHATRAQP